MHSKGNYKQGENTALRLGENNSKRSNKVLISKIYKQLLQLNSIKITDPIKKMGQRPKQTFLQGRHTDGEKTHEKMLNIIHYQRNANQNCDEISLHTS